MIGRGEGDKLVSSYANGQWPILNDVREDYQGPPQRDGKPDPASTCSSSLAPLSTSRAFGSHATIGANITGSCRDVSSIRAPGHAVAWSFRYRRGEMSKS